MIAARRDVAAPFRARRRFRLRHRAALGINCALRHRTRRRDGKRKGGGASERLLERARRTAAAGGGLI